MNIKHKLEAIAEERANIYTKLLHNKKQKHFNNPEKWGPLPPPLEEENYMFKTGFTSATNILLPLLEEAIDALQDQIDSNYDQAGHANNALISINEKLESITKAK